MRHRSLKILLLKRKYLKKVIGATKESIETDSNRLRPGKETKPKKLCFKWVRKMTASIKAIEKYYELTVISYQTFGLRKILMTRSI